MGYSYTIAQLQQMAAGGRIQPTDRFYDRSMGRWRLARDIPEVAPYFPKPKPAVGAFVLALAGLGALALTSGSDTEASRLRSLSWEDLRRAIFRRDGYTCAYCGHRGTSATLEVDHRVPVSRGGTDDPENLTTACWECNREKGDMTAFEYCLSRLWR